MKFREDRASGQPTGAVGFLSNRYFVFGILALVLLCTAAVRLRLRDLPLERDEGEYAYSGQLILQGIPPYQLAYNMKFPGMYLAYATIMAVFGETSAGIHVGFLFVNAVAIVLVFLLTKRIADSAAGLVATSLYAYSSVSGAFVGIWAHATHFVVAFALGGLLLILSNADRSRFWKLLVSGALLGISMLMKQHGVFFIAFAGGYLIYDYGRSHAWKKLAGSLAVFALGVSLPLLSTGLWLWKAGVFGKFWFWTIQYARTYAGQFRGLPTIRNSLEMYTPNVIWLTLGAATPALLILWRRADRSAAVFATGLLGSSILATIPGFNFTWHYFILPLPALTMLSGVVVSAVSQYFYARSGARAAMAPFLIFTIALLLGIASERQLFFQCTPEAAPRLVYGPGFPFEEAVKISNYLKEHASQDARVAVIGSEPQIYFYTHLHSATGYIYTYALMEPQPFAVQMQKEMISEVEAVKPEYLVFIDLQSSWIVRHDSDLTIFNWFRKYALSYEVVGAVDTDDKKVAYYWDDKAPAHEQTSQILVYKRKKT